ncbi:MAG: methyltransferase domain-containing protein [Bacteroidetes bacterium]|nr:methyltransferase domain-containing protein [Bacteroidota bacterium]
MSTTQNSSSTPKFENELDVSFWNQRWISGQTGWDIGYASPPLVKFMEGYPNKDAAILIPGCGNAYEAAHFADNGFSNITLVDISEEAVSRLREKFKHTPQIKIHCEDFFKHQGKYDLILEQTFFCAQVLQRREEYVKKMASLLNKTGKLAGVLFGVSFGESGPPFGGDEKEYRELFSAEFHIDKLEPCYNSIAPRAGSELFFVFTKKQNLYRSHHSMSHECLLLYFYADWCGSCQTMQTVMDRLKDKIPENTEVVKIDLDKNHKLASIYQIRSVPAFILLKSGKEQWRKSGIMTACELEQIILQYNN